MASTPHPAARLLLLGVGQALMFVVGGVAGRWLGLALGCDALADGFGMRVMAGMLLIGLGAGGGAQLARLLYIRRFGHPGV
ncbi:MAG: hypothetical protein EOO24_01605 [Comamonadaceae bacterium]|nr:MAG: hypothetical protein EOO24_01605 [Comamonadaceae bacterium]